MVKLKITEEHSSSDADSLRQPEYPNIKIIEPRSDSYFNKNELSPIQGTLERSNFSLELEVSPPRQPSRHIET
jgi:hypothetical protein